VKNEVKKQKFFKKFLSVAVNKIVINITINIRVYYINIREVLNYKLRIKIR